MRSCAIACCALMAALPALGSAQTSTAVERGRYLIERAGKCSDCHGAKLTGSALDFLNPRLPPIVQRKAPRIAGLPMFKSRAAAAHFLETGRLPNGHTARPPMPEYRFNHADATAIVAYLKSLSP